MREDKYLHGRDFEDFNGFQMIPRGFLSFIKKGRLSHFEAACDLMHQLTGPATTAKVGSIHIRLEENEGDAPVRALAKRWLWSEGAVRHFLAKLEDLGVLEKRVEGTKKAKKAFFRISALFSTQISTPTSTVTSTHNSSDNQEVSTSEKAPISTPTSAPINTPTSTIPKDSKVSIKEEKNSSNFSDDSSSKDSNKKKVARKKRTPNEPNEAIETLLNSFSDRAEIDAIWEDWKEYKQLEYGFKFKSLASEKATLKKLHSLSTGDSETARNIIEEAISNGYKGFFALKPVGGSPASDRGYKGDSESSELNRLYSLKAEEKYRRLNEMNTAFNQSDYETMYGMMSNQGKERFKNGLKTYPKEGMYEALMGKVQEASEGFDETERKYFFYVSENYLRQIGMK